MNQSEIMKNLKQEIKSSYEGFLKLGIHDEQAFHEYKEAIAFSVHTVKAIAKILEPIPNEILYFRGGIGDTLAAVKEYAKNLVSKFGTLNTYKLYDFMSIDLPTLRDTL